MQIIVCDFLIEGKRCDVKCEYTIRDNGYEVRSWDLCDKHLKLLMEQLDKPRIYRKTDKQR